MRSSITIVALLGILAAGCGPGSGIIYGDGTHDDVEAEDLPPVDPTDPGPDDLSPVDPGDVTGDPSWPCVPEWAPQPRLFLGGITVSTGDMDDPDFPELLTAATGQVWLVSRIQSSTSASDTPKTAYGTVNPMTALPHGTINFPLSSVAIDAHHPTVWLTRGYGDSLATVMPDVDGYASNRLVYMINDVMTFAGAPVAISGTDQHSRDPAAASAGSELLAVWKQGNGTDANSRLDFAVIGLEGTEEHRGTAVGDGTTEMGEPAIAWNGTGYGLVYLVHAGPGADRVEFAELADDGTPAGEWRRSWGTTETDTLLAGWPAIEWNGTSYAIVWEESEGSTSDDQAHLHLSMVGPGGASPTDAVLDPSLEPETGNLTSSQPGMMDIAWNGRSWGVVWTHHNPSSGNRAWFFELDPAGTVASSLTNVTPGSSGIRNPRLTWLETATQFSWVFAWNEFTTTSGVHVLYTYSYGCSL